MRNITTCHMSVKTSLSFILSFLFLWISVTANGQESAKPAAPGIPKAAAAPAPAAKAAEPANAGPKPDPRVEKALKEIGFKFSTTTLGNFRVPFKADDGRSQWVYISSRTEKFLSIESRKIWSSVMASKEPLSQELASRMLMENIPQKLGAYELAKTDDGGYKIQFAAKVDANCSAVNLKDALRLVFLTADTKEKELAANDEF